ncbi:MAG TPA: SHOCT domain-containing protein [Candidatus Eisenbacteria bacterium]|nr:SHOCT domain-containing protein [Candidatus Eisenbacteria bacterium]
MGRQQTPVAPLVVVRFLDDEFLEGTSAHISLDEPHFVLSMPEGASNNELAVIPLSSVKRLTFASEAPTAAELESVQRKVAIRFQDGEVLKGYLDGELLHAKYGVQLRLLSFERDQIETLGIPHASLKALFYLKTWDSRPPEFGGTADVYVGKRLDSPLVDLLSDIKQLSRLKEKGAISNTEFQRKRRKILDQL